MFVFMQGFDRENSSITDKDNRWFLKFLHGLTPPETIPESKVKVTGSQGQGQGEGQGSQLIDQHAQPGGDLKFYLQDLKQRAR